MNCHKFLFLLGICFLLTLQETLTKFAIHDPELLKHKLTNGIEMNTHLNGSELRPLESCPIAKDHLCPQNIHIFVIASARMHDEDHGAYVFHRKTVEYYAKEKGYFLHFVDPENVIDQIGSIQPDKILTKLRITSSKSLIMKCKCH